VVEPDGKDDETVTGNAVRDVARRIERKDQPASACLRRDLERRCGAEQGVLAVGDDVARPVREPPASVVMARRLT
jgi:hypothetical protein